MAPRGDAIRWCRSPPSTSSGGRCSSTRLDDQHRGHVHLDDHDRVRASVGARRWSGGRPRLHCDDVTGTGHDGHDHDDGRHHHDPAHDRDGHDADVDDHDIDDDTAPADHHPDDGTVS